MIESSTVGAQVACPSCGSWAVKADRGLAGRMVCARCGHPLGLQSAVGGPLRRRRRWAFSLPKRWRLWWALVTLVGVSAALAAQAPTPVPRERPGVSPGSGWPARPGSLGM